MRRLFRYCPNCGTPNPEFLADKELVCRECGWNYFHNVAAAVGVFILAGADGYDSEDAESGGRRLLLIRRGREPGKGLLDLPGGFVDPRESAEEAAGREVREELGTTLRNVRYFVSYPNRYLFGGVTYNTCDLFFTAELGPGNIAGDRDEIASVEYYSHAEYSRPSFIEELAFDSARRALRDFQARAS